VSAVVAPPGGAGLPPADAPTATTSSNPTTNQDSSAANAPGSTALAATSPSTTSSQTQPSLNYLFTLLEIRENDEIVGTAAPTQSASP
jgi:hypothetical protein